MQRSLGTGGKIFILILVEGISRSFLGLLAKSVAAGFIGGRIVQYIRC